MDPSVAPMSGDHDNCSGPGEPVRRSATASARRESAQPSERVARRGRVTGREDEENQAAHAAAFGQAWCDV
jgi:hypothetical protein